MPAGSSAAARLSRASPTSERRSTWSTSFASAAAGGVVDEALRLDPLPRVIWMQLGVANEEAAMRGRAKGLTVIMNRRPKIEFGRLFGRGG
jgi:hypothetical protein